MCMFKSMILLKDRVYIGNTDSHADMIEALHLRDNAPYGKAPCFAKIEITPPDDDITTPIDDWNYVVDQDMYPDWYVSEVDKPRCYAALKAWAVDHILTGKHSEVKGEAIYLVNASVRSVNGGQIVRMVNSTIQNVRGGTILNVNRIWAHIEKQVDGMVVYTDKTISFGKGKSVAYKVVETNDEYEARFKIGDVIKGTERPSNHYSVTNPRTTRATVIGKKDKEFNSENILIRVDEHMNKYCEGRKYWVNDEFFDLVEPVNADN